MTSRTGLALVLLVLFASPALAQSKGIVVVDRALVWRLDSSVVITSLPLDTVVELTAQSDRWYEIVVPERLGGRGARGLIAVGQVKLIAGSDPPPVRPLRGSPSPPPTVQSRAAALQPIRPAVSVRGFGQAGVMGFAARESFEAIFGRAYAPTFGGGVHLQLRSGAYIQGSIERLRQTGERVFVFDGTAFPLGIPQTVTIHPLMVSGGYRFPSRSAVQPYVGGGVGVHLVREESPFDEAPEHVDERHASYHAHGGIEIRTGYSWIAPAVEAKFTTVPDALGSEGTAAAFEETNLGGWQLQFKVLVGR